MKDTFQKLFFIYLIMTTKNETKISKKIKWPVKKQVEKKMYLILLKINH